MATKIRLDSNWFFRSLRARAEREKQSHFRFDLGIASLTLAMTVLFTNSSFCIPKSNLNINEKYERQIQEISFEVKGLNEKLDKIEQDNKDAKISGIIFFQYYKPLQNPSGSAKNGFDITRAYVDFKKKLDKDASVRLTFDAGRLDPSIDPASKSQMLFDYLKFAYADLPLIPSQTSGTNTLNLRIGLQPTVWTGWVEGFWGKRYISKVLTDNEGLLQTADFGIGAYGKIILPLIHEIEYQTTLSNGTGFKKADNNSAKDFALRLNTNIYNFDSQGNISLGAFINMKDQFPSASTNAQYKGILAAITNKTYGNLYWEYIGASNISGYSLGGFVYPYPKAFAGISLIGRIDFYDPDSTVTNDQINRTILGAVYDFGKNVQIALDIQNKTIGNGNLESLAYIQSMISF